MQKFSVIIAIYNRAEFLTRIVQSVLRRISSSLEVMCIEDASTNDSARLLKCLQAEDSRIKIVCHKKTKERTVYEKVLPCMNTVIIFYFWIVRMNLKWPPVKL